MRKTWTLLMGATLACIVLISAKPSFAQDNKDDFKPSGKFIALVFGDFMYVAGADTAVGDLSNAVLKKQKDYQAFIIRRVNFGYEYAMTKRLSGQIRLEADGSTVTPNNRSTVYIKDAWLKYVLCPNSELIFGIQPTLLYANPEKLWGHRFIEKEFTDLRGYASTRDLALTIQGKIDNNGMFNYAIMYGNNSATSPEADRHKRLYGHILVKPLEFLEVQVYGDQAFWPDMGGEKQNVTTMGVYAGYKGEKLHAGIEFCMNSAQNAMMNNQMELDNLKSQGFSVFGTYEINPISGAFLRADLWDPNTDGDVGKYDKRNFFLFGYTYKPSPQVTISPNVLIETYEKMDQISIDPSIWPRLTFYWQLK